MTIGDLVKMKYQGNGHPNVGVIVAVCMPGATPQKAPAYRILWDLQQWNDSWFNENELRIINESR